MQKAAREGANDWVSYEAGAKAVREKTARLKALRMAKEAADGPMLDDMTMLFDHTDFSVVVKERAPPPRPWRWEIYRAGRKSPIEYSSVLYETFEAAHRAGKEALRQLLTEFPAG